MFVRLPYRFYIIFKFILFNYFLVNIFQLIMLFSPQVIKKIDIFRYLCASNYKELYDFHRRTSRRV